MTSRIRVESESGIVDDWANRCCHLGLQGMANSSSRPLHHLPRSRQAMAGSQGRRVATLHQTRPITTSPIMASSSRSQVAMGSRPRAVRITTTVGIHRVVVEASTRQDPPRVSVVPVGPLADRVGPRVAQVAQEVIINSPGFVHVLEFHQIYSKALKLLEE